MNMTIYCESLISYQESSFCGHKFGRMAVELKDVHVPSICEAVYHGAGWDELLDCVPINHIADKAVEAGADLLAEAMKSEGYLKEMLGVATVQELIQELQDRDYDVKLRAIDFD